MIIFLIFLLFWIGLSFKYSYIVFALLSIFLLLLIYRKYKAKITLITLSVFLIGIGISYIKIDINRDTYSGIVFDSKDNYFLLLSKGERLYVHYKDNPYEIGDYLSIKGKKEKVDFAHIESQFDFQSYLEKKGVIYELNYKHIEINFSTPIRIREKQKEFLSHFDDDVKEVVASILFSNGEDVNFINNIENLHLSRLVNMSGVYLYVFLALLDFLFSYFFKSKWSKLISILFLLPYVIFTFPRFAIIRIFVLQILRWINKNLLNSKFDNLNILGIAGLFFLIFDFHLAYSDSFIIGFSLPIIIGMANEVTREYKKRKRKILLAIIIYLAIIPFEIKYYNSVNPLLLPIQTIFTPLFILLAVSSLLCFYKVPIYGLVKYIFIPINGMSDAFNKINVSFYAPPFNEYFILFYCLGFILFLYYKAIKFIPIYKGIGIALSSFLLLYLLPINNLLTESITFINVGQGDSCLIRKQNHTVLIDTGGSIYSDIARDTLIPYFKKNRIYHIDTVITTHGDFDHSGALESLVNNFYVKNVITEATSFPINAGGIIIDNYNRHIAEYSEENDKSLVLGFNILNKDVLVMGDAPIKVERNMIQEFPNLKCDILKLGHHGSKTSTCDEFIKFLKPEVAIISCGKKNKYGHPNKEVLDILEINHIPYHRTDIEGSISFSNYIFM